MKVTGFLMFRDTNTLFHKNYFYMSTITTFILYWKLHFSKHGHICFRTFPCFIILDLHIIV